MRKLLIYLVVLLLCGIAQAPQKPMLGELPDWSQFPQPVGLWVMNEGSGSIVYDLSGNGNDGTLAATAHFVSGKFGPAINFDGNSDYITVPDSDSLHLPNQLSVSFWIKTTSVARNTVLDHYYRDWEFAIDDPDFLVWFGNDVSYTPLVFSGAFTADGLWHHIVLALNKVTGSCKMWKDGAFIGTESGTAYTGNSTQSLYIASRGAGSAQLLLGDLDNVALFNELLIDEQARQLCIDPFPWFVEDKLVNMYIPPAAEEGGQVIFINFASAGYGFAGFGLVLVWAVIQKLRNRK